MSGFGDTFGDSFGDNPVSFVPGTAHGPTEIVGPTYVLDLVGVYLKRLDTLPWLSAILCDSNGPVDLTAATNIQLMADGMFTSTIINQSVAIQNALIGQILYKWQSADTATVDDFNARFVVTYSGGAVVTFPGYGIIALKVSASVN